MDKITKRKELLALGVHDLRVFARNIGVSSPTTKRKEDLVEEIIAVLSGEKQVAIGSHAGRKATVKLANVQSQSLIIPEELQTLLAKRRAASIGLEGMNAIRLCESIQDNMISLYIRQGFLEDREGKKHLTDHRKNMFVYVNDELVEKHNLLVGDFVTVKSAEILGLDFGVAKEILEVNNKPLTNRVFCDFEKDTIPNGIIVGDFNEGKAFYAEEKLENCLNEAINIMKNFKDKGFSIVLFGTSVQNVVLEKIQEQIDVYDYTIHLSEGGLWTLERLNSYYKNLIIRASSGEKLFVVVLDYKQVLSDIDLALGVHSSEEGFSVDAIRFVAYLSTLCRCLKSGGSISAIGFNK